MDVISHIKKTLTRIKASLDLTPWYKIAVSAVLVLGSTATVISFLWNEDERVVETPKSHTIQGGRVIAGSSAVYKRQARNLQKQIEGLKNEQKAILGSLAQLTKHMETQISRQDVNEAIRKKEERKHVDQPPPQTTQIPQNVGPHTQQTYAPAIAKPIRGPSVISFPTESKSRGKDRIHLSPGSFVETILLSGVQAAGGKPYPVLLKATQSFIGPNKTRIDLSGCFILGKAMGNLSLGRVEIQPYKLACTARSGRLFERDLKGFVADKNDNSFGVIGEVDLKANSRTATLAFLSSMLQGISQNIEKLHTKTTQTDNGSSTSISGNEGRYIVAGGAAGAANKMTDFFLRHASNLLPTINIHSSQKLYVVIQDSVDLPSWFFTRNKKKGENDFAYISRLID